MTMLADSGATEHFLDDDLILGLKDEGSHDEPRVATHATGQ